MKETVTLTKDELERLSVLISVYGGFMPLIEFFDWIPNYMLPDSLRDKYALLKTSVINFTDELRSYVESTVDLR